MTTPDTPLDLDALAALEQAATPAPWEAHMVQPNMAGNHQWYLHPVPRRPAGVHATGRGEDIDLIAAMRNALPALLRELAAAREQAKQAQAEADAALRRLGDHANHLVQQLNGARHARHRIADAHHKHVDGHGGTWVECNECGNGWPCPTYVWATTDRDPLATWDPADDAVPGDGEQAATTCGHTYIGNVGEFACDLYAPHPGKHWNSLAEFAWGAVASARPETTSANGTVTP